MENYKDEFNKHDYLTTNQVCNRLNLKNSDDVSLLIRRSHFPNAVKRDDRWYVPISDLNKYIERLSATTNCLTIKQATERLGYETTDNGSSIRSLIKKSKLPNAFKLKGQWWIPENDIKQLETKQLEANKSEILDTTQVCRRLNLKSARNVANLINRNVFPNAFKDFKGKWKIPLKDIEEYEKALNEEIRNNEMTLGITEVAEMLGLQSKKTVIYHLERNRFPNAFKTNNNWRIPIKDIDNYLSKTKDCLNTVQTAERLGYNATTSVIQLIEKSIFPNAFKVNEYWWIPISDIEEIEKQKFGTLDTNEAAKELNLKSSANVLDLIHKDKLPNAFKDDFNKWRIPSIDIKNFEAEESTDNCIDLNEVAKRLGYQSTTKAKSLWRNNHFPNAFKVGRKIWIPLTDFEKVQEEFYKKERPKKEKPKKEKIINAKQSVVKIEVNTQGFLDLSDAEKILKITRKKIMRIIKRDGLATFIYKGKWWLFQTDIENLKKEIEDIEEKKSNTLSVAETAERTGATSAAITQNIRSKFPNAFKLNSTWRIPIKDVYKYEEETKFIDDSEYTTQIAIAELTHHIGSLDIKRRLRETNRLYLKFCVLQINNTKGSMRYVKSRVLMYLRLYKQLINLIDNEIYLISPDILSPFVRIDVVDS